MNDHAAVPPAGGPLSLYIHEAAKRRLDLYSAECPLEISGVGEVWLVPGASGNPIVISQVFLLEQVSSHAHTELTAGGLASLLGERAAAGLPSESIRLWWHSHAAMPAFWSATDEAAISSFNYVGWLVSIVTNRRGEILARLDIFPSTSQPLRRTFAAALIELPHSDEEERAEVRAEIQRKVRRARVPRTPEVRVAVTAASARRNWRRSA